MEGGYQLDSTKQNNPEEVPSLPKKLASKSAPGFDYVEDRVGMNGTPSNHQCANGIDAEASKSEANLAKQQLCESTVPANQSHQSHVISINMPASPSGRHIEATRKVVFIDEAEQNTNHGQPDLPPGTSVSSQRANLNIHSESIPADNAYNKTTVKEIVPVSLGRSKSDRIRDKRFDSFKTWSGRLERQISNLRGIPLEEEPEANGSLNAEIAALPVERYFDALEGPELDMLKAVRINFFRGFRFSLAWWAYTFPMTGAAIATIRYSTQVKNPLTQTLSVALSAISTFTVFALLATTIIRAFVLRDLFPNDISIAITEGRPKLSKKRVRLIWGSPYNREGEASVAIGISG